MVIRSTFPDVDIPRAGLIPFIFSNPFNAPQDHPIYVDPIIKKSLTYSETKDSVLRFAAGLQDVCEFKKGDVLAVFAPNQYDYFVPTLGAIAAGGSATTANPNYTSRELIHQLTTSKAKVLVAHETNISIALAAAKAVGIRESNIFVFGERAIDGVLPYTQSLFSERRVAIEVMTPEESDERVAYLCFSSGTTGKSKGVMSTHSNIIANILQYTAFEGHHLETKRDKLIGAVPFFHIMGLVLLGHVALHKGVSLYVMPKFDFVQFLEIVQKEKITFTIIVPPIILLLAKSPIVENYDISSLRQITCGAAPLGADIASLAKKRVPTACIKQGYGATETSACVCVQSSEKVTDGSSGLLLPNVEIKIVDENGSEVKAGERGELLIKGPNIMKGYIGNPQATVECLDKDGYYHSGDVVVYKDEELFIVDRLKELIKYKAFQVPPAELEALLLKSDIIADCAVIGIYDAKQATEIPVGYIVLNPGVPATNEIAESIKKYIAGNVVYYKQLRGIRFVKEIPKNPSGKILRRVLRDSVKQEANISRL
ncbi:hypothetical protein BY458DRAFT_526649 [Sporodiniella umbellata]|nr:hypothetical protein BY458DRAFT_526649 [Sporodiniella umbellata]